MSNRSTPLAHPPKKTDDTPSPEHSGGVIAILQVQPYGNAPVVVTSPAVGVDGALDPAYAQEGDDWSPALEWSAVDDAEAWAVIVQDPDAPVAEPVTHWAIWDIVGQAVGLPADIEKIARPETPQNAVQGLNSHGASGYMGPKPPPGHGKHRYHFQVFALGKALGLPPETPLADLVSALKGNTLAAGELIATFETPDPADLEASARGGVRGAPPETA